MDKEKMSFYSLLFDEEIYYIVDDLKTSLQTEEIDTSFTLEPASSAESLDDVFSDVVYLGNNASKLCLLVYYPGEEWIIVRDKLFLEKILASVHLSFDKTALINIAGLGSKRFTDIHQRMPGNNFIGFGLPVTFTEKFPTDTMFRHQGSKIIFSASGLTDIAMDKNKKSVLWKNLKEMFGL